MAPQTQERAHVNAFIDRAHRERLAELARANDRSISAEVRAAVAAHVERDPEPEEAHR